MKYETWLNDRLCDKQIASQFKVANFPNFSSTDRKSHERYLSVYFVSMPVLYYSALITNYRKK